MEQHNAFNAAAGSAYCVGEGDNWMNTTCDSWPFDPSFPNTIVASSPLSASFTSISSSNRSTSTNYDYTRRSSIVSPSDSTYSEELLTPPVTPQRSRTFYFMTDAGMTFKPTLNAFVPFNPSVDHQYAEPEYDWKSRNWQLPTFVPQYQRLLFNGLSDNNLSGNISVPPFAPHTNDPALTRQMFSSPAYASVNQEIAKMPDDWSLAASWSNTQTIAPRATVQSTLPDQPAARIGPCSSPLETNLERTEFQLDSSPLPALVPYVTSSQEMSIKIHDQEGPSLAVVPSQTLQRKSDRVAHRAHSQKITSAVVHRPRRHPNAAVRDAVIPQNTYTCTIAGCKKRFRRQEHRKRHETTVLHDAPDHTVKPGVRCWIKQCNKKFLRTDNLKQHVIKTHGKNSPAQRNCYAATLDINSQYYDPQYHGELTEDGFPLTAMLTTHQCQMAGCGKTYHREDKFRTHLLQHHGQKNSDPDVSTKSKTRKSRSREADMVEDSKENVMSIEE